MLFLTVINNKGLFRSRNTENVLSRKQHNLFPYFLTKISTLIEMGSLELKKSLEKQLKVHAVCELLIVKSRPYKINKKSVSHGKQTFCSLEANQTSFH